MIFYEALKHKWNDDFLEKIENIYGNCDFAIYYDEQTVSIFLYIDRLYAQKLYGAHKSEYWLFLDYARYPALHRGKDGGRGGATNTVCNFCICVANINVFIFTVRRGALLQFPMIIMTIIFFLTEIVILRGRQYSPTDFYLFAFQLTSHLFCHVLVAVFPLHWLSVLHTCIGTILFSVVHICK